MAEKTDAKPMSTARSTADRFGWRAALDKRELTAGDRGGAEPGAAYDDWDTGAEDIGRG